MKVTELTTIYPKRGRIPKKLYCFWSCSVLVKERGGERGGKKEVCRTAASSPFTSHDRSASPEHNETRL